MHSWCHLVVFCEGNDQKVMRVLFQSTFSTEEISRGKFIYLFIIFPTVQHVDPFTLTCLHFFFPTSKGKFRRLLQNCLRIDKFVEG